MAIQFADSFDIYGNSFANMAGSYINDGAGIIQLDNANGRTGTYALFLGENASLRKIIPVPGYSIGVAAAFKFPSLPTSASHPTQLANFKNVGSGEIMHFDLLPNGAIKAWRGGNSIGVSNPCILPNAYYHLEIFVFADPLVGYVEVRVNSAPVLIIQNANTANDPADYQINAVSWIVPPFAFGAVAMWMDDLVIWDTSGAINNGFIGDRRCLTFFPNSDGAPQNWVPTGGGAAYTQISDTPPNDASYISTANVGDKATFGLPDLPANAYDVAAICLMTRLSKDDASDCAVRSAFITGGVAQQSPDMHPVIGFQNWQQVFNKNPLTNVHYSVAEFNAGVLQLERTI